MGSSNDVFIAMLIQYFATFVLMENITQTV